MDRFQENFEIWHTFTHVKVFDRFDFVISERIYR